MKLGDVLVSAPLPSWKVMSGSASGVALMTKAAIAPGGRLISPVLDGSGRPRPTAGAGPLDCQDAPSVTYTAAESRQRRQRHDPQEAANPSAVGCQSGDFIAIFRLAPDGARAVTDKPANSMWGGRFSPSPAEIMQEINASIGFDKALAPQDIRGSKAHAAMLAEQGIITKADARRDHRGPRPGLGRDRGGHVRVLARARRRAHERREPADGAHRRRRPAGCTRRARATTRWRPTSGCTCATPSTALDAGAWRRCSWRSPRKAEAHAATVMPGFTHLQPAQPVTFGHHLLAYVEMLGARPRPACRCARRGSTNARSGSAALAGTSFPIDRHMTAEALGFDRPMRQLARCRLRPRLRARDPGGRGHLRPCICRGLPKRSSSG